MEQRSNHENYSDPTAEKAIGKVMREQKLKERKEKETCQKENIKSKK